MDRPVCSDPTTGEPSRGSASPGLENLDHPGVAESIWLNPGKVQEFRHTFVMRAQQLRVDHGINGRLVRHNLKSVALEEVHLESQAKDPGDTKSLGIFQEG